MLKRHTRFFACLILVLMPLQAFAMANISVCNGLMQSQQIVHDMSCHEHMSGKHQEQHGKKDICKSNCASRCASLSAMVALPSMAPATASKVSAQAVDFPQLAYVSITQPGLQRPPISFI